MKMKTLPQKPDFPFMHFMVKSPKMNAAPDPLKTQNKPISKPTKIAITFFHIRTKDYGLRTAEGKNKPKQTHFSNRQQKIAMDDFTDVSEDTTVNLCVFGGKRQDFPIDLRVLAQIVY